MCSSDLAPCPRGPLLFGQEALDPLGRDRSGRHTRIPTGLQFAREDPRIADKGLAGILRNGPSGEAAFKSLDGFVQRYARQSTHLREYSTNVRFGIWFNVRMGSFPTRQQWLIVILVNVVISAITTILVVRVMTRPADAVDAPVRSAVAATQPAPEATPRAQIAATPAPTLPALAATPIPPTATRPAPTPTAAPLIAPEKVAIVISNINFPGQRQRESVVIANEGDTLDLKGWTLSSPRGVVYTFGNVSLFKDNFINIYTTTGADIATDLFMNRADAAWQVGDVVTLAREGRAQATYTIKP